MSEQAETSAKVTLRLQALREQYAKRATNLKVMFPDVNALDQSGRSRADELEHVIKDLDEVLQIGSEV